MDISMMGVFLNIQRSSMHLTTYLLKNSLNGSKEMIKIWSKKPRSQTAVIGVFLTS